MGASLEGRRSPTRAQSLARGWEEAFLDGRGDLAQPDDRAGRRVNSKVMRPIVRTRRIHPAASRLTISQPTKLRAAISHKMARAFARLFTCGTALRLSTLNEISKIHAARPWESRSRPTPAFPPPDVQRHDRLCEATFTQSAEGPTSRIGRSIRVRRQPSLRWSSARNSVIRSRRLPRLVLWIRGFDRLQRHA